MHQQTKKSEVYLDSVDSLYLELITFLRNMK